MTDLTVPKPKFNRITSGPNNFGGPPLVWAYEPD